MIACRSEVEIPPSGGVNPEGLFFSFSFFRICSRGGGGRKNSIRYTSMMRRYHENNFCFLIYLIKESPRTDSIAPGLGLKTFQLLHMRSKIRRIMKLGINKFAKLVDDLGMP